MQPSACFFLALHTCAILCSKMEGMWGMSSKQLTPSECRVCAADFLCKLSNQDCATDQCKRGGCLLNSVRLKWVAAGNRCVTLQALQRVVYGVSSANGWPLAAHRAHLPQHTPDSSGQEYPGLHVGINRVPPCTVWLHKAST